jgi:hypothetical protein
MPSPDEGEVKRPWTRDEFQRAVEKGVFGPEERLELLGGKIYRKMTQNNPHATAILKTARALTAVFGDRSSVFAAPDRVIYGRATGTGRGRHRG